MKSLRIVALVFAAFLAATSTLPAQETLPEDALECTGDGLIHVVADECMHDGGRSAAGDSLEVYCHLGISRFCLSGEECPWRGGESPVGGDNRTCSSAGLGTEWMATAWCEGWSGFNQFECTEAGQIELRQVSEDDLRQTRDETGC